MGILSNLEPKLVFKYFEEISSIPRGSGNTEAISGFCENFAKDRGLEYVRDAYGNIIIFKPGSAGYEKKPRVMLQGHLDMVCEKEAGCDIDFKKDGLSLSLENGEVSAVGTTLGGDDGIAIAYALAVLASDDISHPPIEAVFTVDEEIGMIGAKKLDFSMLKSRTMLNIDSEEEGCLLVGCAGGATVRARIPIKRAVINGVIRDVAVNGLTGGHSGIEIDKGRANSNVILGRVLRVLSKEAHFNIISMNGGLKDNAIPRESKARILFDSESDASGAGRVIRSLENILLKEYGTTDSGIKLSLSTPSEKELHSSSAFDDASTAAAIAALAGFPNGVQRMNPDAKDLVQTSLNLGVLESTDDEAIFSFCVRSSVESEKEELISRIECLTKAFGGNVFVDGSYPAWEYKKDSPLCRLMAEIFKEKYGKKPYIRTIHAGVECGIFSAAIPNLDCVSFGPDIYGIHTPNEKMSADSVLRTWNYLLETLKRL